MYGKDSLKSSLRSKGNGSKLEPCGTLDDKSINWYFLIIHIGVLKYSGKNSRTIPIKDLHTLKISERTQHILTR